MPYKAISESPRFPDDSVKWRSGIVLNLCMVLFDTPAADAKKKV